MTPKPAQPAESPEAIPNGISYSVEHDNFYADNKGMGEAFWRKWKHRSGDFPAATTARPTERGAVETWESIAAWCEETFGPVTLARTAERANEEMQELLAEPENVIEAADVCIVLSRYPGLWDAVERKMAINRARTWDIRDDGTGYHIPAALTPPVTVAATDQAGEVERSTLIFTAINDPTRWAGDCGERTIARWRADAVAAALDTQTATGRTMGGEVSPELAELITGIRNVAAPDSQQWGMTLEGDEVALLAAYFAALQNGGE